MSSPSGSQVPVELVRVAIDAARQRGVDVADLPLTVLAEELGISRSTVVRRLGGSRRALDDAVREQGVDPGGVTPVRERAVASAARMISESGLASVTLEAVAVAAGCSVHSLYAAFGGRDGLFGAVYESYGPLLEIEELLRSPSGSLEEIALDVYRVFLKAMGRASAIAAAMIADALSRPDGPGAVTLGRYLPRVLASFQGWLGAEIAAGRVRALPVPVLVQQLMGPLLAHVLFRSVTGGVAGAPSVPDVEQVCEAFARGFARAVETPGSGSATSDGERAR